MSIAASLLFSTLTAIASPTAPAPTALERRLHPASVEASSFLWNDWNKFQENYHPNYVADDDPKTAWTEGVKGNGEGEWLRVRITKLDNATAVRLRLRNGYHKSKNLYKANARPKSVTFKLLPGGVEKVVELADKMEWIEVALSQPAGVLEGVELKVNSVYPGSKYEDTCLSDLEVFATSTTPDNPAFEKSRFERLSAWKKERVDAAAAFKKESAGHMPVAPAYRLTAGVEVPEWANTDKCNYEDPACTLRAGLQRFKEVHGANPLLDRGLEVLASTASAKPMQPIAKENRPLPPVDGLERFSLYSGEYGPSSNVSMPAQLGFLSNQTVGVFELRDPPTVAQAVRAEAKGCKGKTDTSFAWVKQRAQASGPAAVEGMLVVTCGQVEGREGYYSTSAPMLLVYDDKGRLGLLATVWEVTKLEWTDATPPTLAALVRLARYGEESGRFEAVQPTLAAR